MFYFNLLKLFGGEWCSKNHNLFLIGFDFCFN